MSIDDGIIVRAATNDDCARVRELVFEILDEYGLQGDPDGIDRDISDIESNFTDRGGIFEVLENEEGKMVGTVGLYPLDDRRVELRKMYFVPEIRGKGRGKQILTRMIRIAADSGFKQIVLETASVLKEAIGLYEKFGFKETTDKHAPRCDRAYYLDL